MVTEATAVRRPSRAALTAIEEGLAEMEAYFGVSRHTGDLEGEEPSADREAPDTEIAEEGYDDDEEASDESSGDSDREEVEVALDAFISFLLDEGMIRKSKSGKLPSFADIFSRFFGKEHEIAVNARSFEAHIEGYFGWISSEDMRLARDEFLAIQEGVKKILEGKSDAQ
jgi:hypothetical protein